MAQAAEIYMKFIDSIEIKVKAGKGGDGAVSFMRAPCKPKMGPDGGDGGKGGSVILRGNAQLNTLSAIRYEALFKAGDGVRGGNKNWRGAFGEDLIIQVPLGTVIHEAETGKVMGELMNDGDEMMVAKGGRHGLGNTHWVSSRHQVPEESRPGEPGEERTIRLELKLLADVGLAGFPNAGKSTLLSVVSAARPKIADYPFTTLVPNLGVAEIRGRNDYDVRSLVIADVPGLIEGASEGKGLGLQFLKHLERTSLIAYVLDAADELNPAAQALAVLRQELARFSPELGAKRSVVILNKTDLLDDEAIQIAKAPLEVDGTEVLVISGATGSGLHEMKTRLYELVAEEKRRAAAALPLNDFQPAADASSTTLEWSREDVMPPVFEEHSGSDGH